MALLVVLLSTVGVVLLYNALSSYRSLQRNLAKAKTSGLPIVITPWHVYTVFWLATHSMWLPLLRKLPASYQGLWIDIMNPEWAYRIGHRPFATLGSDVFLTVSPRKINAFVADAEVITQITTRRNDFPKPLQMYRRLNLFGRNVVATEGAEWRMHRKVTAPSFGEKNNELVFIESVHHSQALLKLWTGPGQHGNRTVDDPKIDTMRFALYIISRAGFDVRVVWPHEETETNHSAETAPDARSLFAGSKPPPGHKMNYRQALSSLLENIIWTQMAPPEYLTKSPFKVHQEIGTAVIEWGKYMDELYEAKKNEVASGQENSGMDLFQAMIRGSGILDSEKKSDLQKSDILGNAFVLMLAGHETTANTLHFSLLYLAMNLQSQRHLQNDIDEIFKGRPIESWTYEDDFPKLFDSMAAAVMNETLRLLQPIINIPKSTAPGHPQVVHMDGKEYTIPDDVSVFLCSAVHRNPKYWPCPANDPSTNGRPDVDRFRPERWLGVAEGKAAEEFVDINYDDEILRGPSGQDTSAQLFKPAKGSFIPFSEGYRSCIGRRFAQVEILTVFAVIFSQYSVELAVDEFATDDEVERMPKGGKERKAVWQKAVDRADDLLTNKMASMITLQLRAGNVPIRIVRRGEERFDFE